MRILSALLVSSLSLGACRLPEAPRTDWPEPERRFVGMSFEVTAANALDTVDNRVDVLTRDAAALLGPGRRIAFYPPDSCRQTTAAPEGAQQVELVGMNCGVLMSSLETTAAKAGYEVVSWQLLKNKGALEAAKSFDIAVLLEVDQYSVNDRRAVKVSSANFEFFLQDEPDVRLPLAVARETALACKELVDAQIRNAIGSIADVEDSATLAVKAVDVKSGRALWYYQKTLRLGEDARASRHIDLYFALDGTRPSYTPPQPSFNAMQKFGGMLLAIGSAGAAAGAGMTAVRRYPEANTGVGILTSSLLVAGAGITLIALGNRKATREAPTAAPAPPPAEYPDAESQLCRSSTVTPPWARAREPEAPETPTSPEKQSNYDFEEKTGGARDRDRRRSEELSRRAADDLVAELQRLAAAGLGR